MNPLSRPVRSLAWLGATILLSTGCGVFGLKGLDTAEPVVDTGGLTEQVTLVSISPDRGALNTETDVTIRGTGFLGEVGLSFGNTAVDVTVISDTELIATTPAVPVEAAVDVTVTSDLGEAVMMGGFRFTDDPGGDDGGSGDGGDDGGGSGSGSGSGSGDDNSGMVTGYAEHNYFVVGCPSCLGYAGYESVESFAIFHPPTNGSWFDWMPRQGQCVVNPNRSHPTSSYSDMGSTALLSAGSSSVSMSKATEGGMTYYASTSSSSTAFARNTSYDLLAPYAATPLSVSGAVRTISTGFSSIEPIDIFNDSYSAFTPFYASSAVFSWSPAGNSDGVVIAFLIFDATGSTYRGEVFCWVADNGVFQVPVSDLASVAYSGDLAMVYYYKSTHGYGIHPDDGSTIETSSAFGGLGTITLY